MTRAGDVASETVGQFTVGTRVERPVNVYASSSLVRSGTVTRAYSEAGYDELYDVRWDTEGGKPIEPFVGVGYFRHGLAMSWKQDADRANVSRVDTSGNTISPAEPRLGPEMSA